MPFGLKNAGATFQWAMDMAFANEKDVFLVVYLDDLMLFSKPDEKHMYHLKTIFQKCRKYGLSLNPKKSLFAIEEGKLLGHIISKDGIHIDPAHVQAIQQIDLPRNKKEIQSFNEHTMADVLMQKRDDHERPITFFSRATRDAALKYNIIEKQTLALVKELKDFRVYILHSHILAYVPNATVKDVLVQTDPEGRRGKWIASLLEYDVEIKPTKLVKG
eukprot:PITA_17602